MAAAGCIRNPRHPASFFLCYGARDSRAANVNQSKFEIGLVPDSDRFWALPECPQSPPTVHLKTEPPGARLVEFLPCRHTDWLRRLRRFLSCRFGLGQRSRGA